jgi:hypothetical protein
MSPEEYTKGFAILQKQKHCQICGSEAKLLMDHSPETGRFRGILCWPCNRAVGIIERIKAGDPQYVAALKYIQAPPFKAEAEAPHKDTLQGLIEALEAVIKEYK